MAINSGKPRKAPTIIDVAREASVGVMTVSRVINHHPSVKSSTRARVMSAIARVGYIQNDAARMLKGRRARTIGLIVPDLTDYFAACFQTVQEIAMRHGYQTLVIATGKSSAVEGQQLDSLNNQRPSGIILVSCGPDTQRISRIINSGIPVIALDRPLPGLNVDAVLVDNREGARRGVDHLIEHGHKRIACVAYAGGSYTSLERIRGYEEAVREAGLQPILYRDVQSPEQMEALVRSWSNSPKSPTAVFSIKRLTSIRLIQAMHRTQVRVPQDVALVGFDDFELAEVLSAPLTVVSQSPRESARAAAEQLFKTILSPPSAREENRQAIKIVFPTTLVIRRSCGCHKT